MPQFLFHFAFFTLAAYSVSAAAMGLMVEPALPHCALVSAPLATPPATPLPAAATYRLAGSQAVRGSRDIAWAWLGTPTNRYPHKALGSVTHAASLHVLPATTSEAVGQVGAKVQRALVFTLPLHKVFEDLTVRLIDIDGDGRDEVIVIESDAVRGAATVVYGLAGQALVERARSPYAGGTFRWLNYVGVADFDGDGHLDIASVITPHIGGTLTLYHYRPPLLEPYARAMDTSNHRMGDPELDLAVIVELAGVRPTIIVPDMSLKALHALRWEAPGQWKELADVKPMPARVQRMTNMPGGACIRLSDNTWRRIVLAQ